MLEKNPKISSATFTFVYLQNSRKIPLSLRVSDTFVKLKVHYHLPDIEFYQLCEDVTDAYFIDDSEVLSRCSKVYEYRNLILQKGTKIANIDFFDQIIILSDTKNKQMFWSAIKTFGELCGSL